MTAHKSRSWFACPRLAQSGRCQRAQTNLATAGLAGNAAAAPTLGGNNTFQYPSLQAIEAAYANGSITAAQRVAYRLASQMEAQVQIQAAEGTLRAGGDFDPT
jgi:hypothetical protein